MKRFLMIAIALGMAGCVTYAPTVPEGYQGGLASINDTCSGPGTSWAHFFYLEEIDGKKVKNARDISDRVSTGQGRNLSALGYRREVPAETLSLTIAANRLNAAPISDLFDRSSSSEGVIEVALAPGGIYSVRGIVEKEFSAVWLEDLDGNRVSAIIESPDAAAEIADRLRAIIPATSGPGAALSRQQQFSRLPECEHSSVVEAKLGAPDDISERSGSAWTMRPRTTIYHYTGMGEVHFIGRGEELFVSSITRTALTEEELTPFSLEERLHSENADALRAEARGLYSQRVNDPVMLDMIGQRLWEEKYATDPVMIDAMAWFCRVLGQSGDGRYRPLLNDIAKETGDRKLRRYAEAGRDALPSGSSQVFTPVER